MATIFADFICLNSSSILNNEALKKRKSLENNEIALFHVVRIQLISVYCK